jgi:energy-coupling factor transport system permease protein
MSSFDPRSLVLLYLGFSITVTWTTDLRLLCAAAIFAAAAAAAARLSLRESRRAWITMLILIVVFGGTQLLFGRGWLVAAQQALRLLSLFLLTLAVAKSIDPALYGITFRRLGAPDKLAFAVSLMMRYIPTLSRDLDLTVDAQRARGFELDPRRGSLLARARRFAPLLVPVVVRSVLDSQDVADAMDLRAFGAQRRTWLRDLRFSRRDLPLLALAAALPLAAWLLR